MINKYRKQNMIKINLGGNPINPACLPPPSNIPPLPTRIFKNLDFFPLTNVLADLFCFDIWK